MQANPAAVRERERRLDLELEIDALVHDARLHELIALGPHLEMLERGALVAENESVEDDAEVGALDRHIARRYADPERARAVQQRASSWLRWHHLAAQQPDSNDRILGDAEVDVL